MTTADWAFTVSILSLLIAMCSFVWNVWSKFIFPKPRIRITFAVMSVFPDDGQGDFLSLSATNYGPGEVTLHSAIVQLRRRRLFQRRLGLGILAPYNDLMRRATDGPFSGGLPKKLNIGEQFSVYFPVSLEGLRDGSVVRVGFADTFGRYHYCARNAVRRTAATLAKDRISES